MDGALLVVPIRTPLGDVVGTLNVDTLCEEDLTDGASSDPTIEPHEQNFHQVSSNTNTYMYLQATVCVLNEAANDSTQCSCHVQYVNTRKMFLLHSFLLLLHTLHANVLTQSRPGSQHTDRACCATSSSG